MYSYLTPQDRLKKQFEKISVGDIFVSSAVWTLILIFCCLVFTTLISYRATQGLIEDNTWVLHSQEVIEQVLETSVNFRTAESRQRGYLLTGQSKYLENYHDSILKVGSHLEKLKKLVADNFVRQAQVRSLEQIVERRLAIMQSVLNAYKNEGMGKARQVLVDGGGLQAMNEFTKLIDIIETDEKKLLNERSISSIESRNYALRGLVVGGLFSVTLVLFSYYLLINDLRRRQHVVEEITNARDTLEAKVAERTQELEQSNRELQEFTYIASHDLQEPLRKIQIFGDRLKNKSGEQLDESARDYLERMQNAAKRMHTLINDLLLFSRVSVDGKMENFKSVDINQIVQEVLSDLEGSLEHYDGHVCVDTLPFIKVDPVQMRQLLQNILSNALKFHRLDVPPEISVIWHNQTNLSDPKTTENFIEIAVIDNGIGIASQFVDKIFIPFQRLHGKNEYEGTGIGLAVCRKIIERHHGYIRVMPAPSEQGTKFILGFPME